MLFRNSLLLIALTTLGASSASAQVVLDRIVGLNEFGDPLVISRINGQMIASLAMAAGVPMGFEGAPSLGQSVEIIATKKPLRGVLDAIVAADGRYGWQEHNGVIVIRPIEAWGDGMSLLHRPVEHMTLENISANDVLTVMTRMFGVNSPSQGLDTRRFSVEVHEGATILDALNAIVRGHGTLTWVLAPASNPAYPGSIHLFVGSSGVGVGIPAEGRQGFTADYYASSEAIRANAPLLERIVGTRRDRSPFAMSCVTAWSVLELAGLTGVPMGFELVPPSEGRVRCWSDGVSLSGLTLRDALDALVILDPRYEWRDVYGVINVRPATASFNSQNNLYRLVPGIRLEDVSSAKAINTFITSLTGAPSYSSMSDTRRLSIDVPRGIALDLLNELARTHGELSWAWEDITAAESQDWPPGSRYKVTFSVGGLMQASAVP